MTLYGHLLILYDIIVYFSNLIKKQIIREPYLILVILASIDLYTNVKIYIYKSMLLIKSKGYLK